MKDNNDSAMLKQIILAFTVLAVSLGSVRAEQSVPLKFEPRVVVPRSFPAITNAPFVQATDATEQLVRDEELVLGVVVNGKPRAYPINMLTGPRREIINDTLGERPIAATW